MDLVSVAKAQEYYPHLEPNHFKRLKPKQEKCAFGNYYYLYTLKAVKLLAKHVAAEQRQEQKQKAKAKLRRLAREEYEAVDREIKENAARIVTYEKKLVQLKNIQRQLKEKRSCLSLRKQSTKL
eukprot:TRINITY_DN67802_c4_g3_i1.p1 TRINITY_DN67802_c4_g3~~TRINITY_DN67802_c4_g3_i1.p1  ORF type:complete len:124 (-),score=7.29 TRINITY_DN67802_c4_g3_i1:185-556(-)